MFTLRFITATIATLVFLMLSSLAFICEGQEKGYRSFEARGIVTDGSSPLAGARVRMKTTPYTTETDEDGFFVIRGRINEGVFRPTVTAWKDGYFIRGVGARNGAKDLVIRLPRFTKTDYAGYEWIPPEPGEIGIYRPGYKLPPDNTEDHCANCHSWTSKLYDRWKGNAHANSHRNPYFLSFYSGTDLTGERKVGPGFKLDNPDDSGKCATCHTPAAALDAPLETDVSRLSDASTNGIHCDFCHKIYAVKTDDIGKKPGVLSMELIRPAAKTQFFAGPFDDDDHGAATYSPIYTKSEYCAPCHQGNIVGDIGYSTYSEWKASPYSARGIECQTCHMPPDGVTTNCAPGPSKQFDWGLFYPLGAKRDPSTLASHITRQNEEKLLAKAAALGIETCMTEDDLGKALTLEIRVTNFSAGHHLPAGHAMRNIVLLVSAVDADGNALECLEGERIPEWGGNGATEDGDYFGQPGKIFAKVLEDSEGNRAVPIWRAVRLHKDTRIPAYATDVSMYRFRLPPDVPSSPNDDGPVRPQKIRVAAKLIYRRFFRQVVDAKGYGLPDKVLISKERHLATGETASDDSR